jgi:hypothetical protein
MLHSVIARSWDGNTDPRCSPDIILRTVKSRMMEREKRSYGNRKLRREDNIIMDVKKLGDCVDWI